jgi:uncharacterized protein
MSAAFITEVAAAARTAMAEYDASHSFDHIERVRRVALRLARDEGVDDADALVVIEAAALLHDLDDHKYGGHDDGARAAAVLATHGLPGELRARVLAAIAGVSFSGELSGGAEALPLEAAIVQDADRLDAIGAIGVARCLTFGGARGRVLYDPAVPPAVGLTKEQYRDAGRKSTSINHFCESRAPRSPSGAPR